MDGMRRMLCCIRGTSWSQAEAKGRERDEEKGREEKRRETDVVIARMSVKASTIMSGIIRKACP